MESGNEPPFERVGEALRAETGAVPARSKSEWRTDLLARRAEVPADVRDAEARSLAAHLGLMDGVGPGVTVCGYVPFGSEPGSSAMLDVLRNRGARVLVPVVPAARGPLDWAEYTGASSLAGGRMRGVLEPSGARLGPSVVAAAALMFIPALAVDHAGVRLGRGAGFYDRTLTLASEGAVLVGLVRDEELVPRLPAERHDVLMHAALTPSGGLVALSG